MKKLKKKYQKPTIKSKAIKINFFMSKITWLDQFKFVGDVYAQSGDGGYTDGYGCGDCA